MVEPYLRDELHVRMQAFKDNKVGKEGGRGGRRAWAGRLMLKKMLKLSIRREQGEIEHLYGKETCMYA
eukprot:1158599-Pelagomonas_calceolata.AAC.3